MIHCAYGKVQFTKALRTHAVPDYHQSVRTKFFSCNSLFFWRQTLRLPSGPNILHLPLSETITVFQNSTGWFSYIFAKSLSFLGLIILDFAHISDLIFTRNTALLLCIHSSLYFQKLLFFKALQFGELILASFFTLLTASRVFPSERQRGLLRVFLIVFSGVKLLNNMLHCRTQLINKRYLPKTYRFLQLNY